ncbi:MAG: hypothetical protein ACODAG_07720 [Myxococcota bacterium]
MASNESLKKHIRGRRKPILIPFPGEGSTEVGIRLLSEKEIDDAKLRAQRYLQDRCKRQSIDPSLFVDIDPEFYDRERIRQIVHRATVDPASISDHCPEGVPFFELDEDLRDVDAVTVQALFDAYLDLQQQRSTLKSVSPEEAAEFASALATGDEAEQEAVLTAFDDEALRNLVRAMAALCREKG